MSALNGQQIIDQFENYVDDSLDGDLELQLVNDAKDEIEDELDLYICKKVDITHSTTVGQIYTTAVALPAKFLNFSKKYILVGTQKFYGIALEDKLRYKDTPGYFYYDPADGIHLCGTQNSVQVISIPYKEATSDLTLSTSPVWPARFHGLIAMQMAFMFYPIDGGDKSRSWTPEWLTLFERKKMRMIDWDARLKLTAQGGKTGYADNDNEGTPLEYM